MEGKQMDLREMAYKRGRWMKIMWSCAESQIFSTSEVSILLLVVWN